MRSDSAPGMMVSEASDILGQLSLPERQQNERSALTLLALLDLKPGDPWKHARSRTIGITSMMEFFGKHYGKKYAPNSRETIRRQTIHQFMEASLVIKNPDDPKRPTNSRNTVYSIHPDMLDLIRRYGTKRWKRSVKRYAGLRPSLRARYAQTRDMGAVPLRLADGGVARLSPGGQSVLVKRICEDFGSRFVPGGTLLLAGDTARESGIHNRNGLRRLGVRINPHGKQPDVIIHDTRKELLVVVEAVTSHGPIDQKRRDELGRLFSKATVGTVYVTAFLDRKTMARHVRDISWETEVWIADSPDHMIHFDGGMFLGTVSSD